MKENKHILFLGGDVSGEGIVTEVKRKDDNSQWGTLHFNQD